MIGGFSPWTLRKIQLRLELKLPSCLEGKVGYMRSCNGLVCLSNEGCDSICIWNPCTRQYKMFSVPNYAFGVWHCLGFGFDSIGNNYKILWIVTKVVRDLRGFIVSMNLKPEAQLYSAKADTWKKIRVPDTIRISFWNRLKRSCGPDISGKRSCGPDISGKLYLEGEGGLLPFDLRNDVFGELVVLPFLDYNVEQKRIKKSKILDFEGSLAMVYESAAGDESVLSLWMLDDAGLWIKKFNLEMDLELDRMNKQASVLKASYYWRVFSMDTVEESVELKLPSRLEEAQLYSANADTWKMIRTPDTIKISFWHKLKRFCGPDISGKLYMEGEGELLPFDLRNDVFGEIVVLPFPDYVEQKRIKKSKILDFEGSVAMVYESAGDESVMKLDVR
ncbi:hypothetical protein ACET3Z_029579 [Daucus carota]